MHIFLSITQFFFFKLKSGSIRIYFKLSSEGEKNFMYTPYKKIHKRQQNSLTLKRLEGKFLT